MRLFALAVLLALVTGSLGIQCWVGFLTNTGSLHGGSLDCAGTCLTANATASKNASITLFACEPMGICDPSPSAFPTGLGPLTLKCCNNTDNCNVKGYPVPPTPSGPPPTVAPILCYEGVYMNNVPLSKKEVPTTCYGDCASVSFNAGTYNYTVATCDPVSLCKDLDLGNSCHQMPQKIVSGCCCSSNLCIDPEVPRQPTPPPPPPGSIKCYAGLHITDTSPTAAPIIQAGAEVYCRGQCHNTTFYLGGAKSYTVYSCDPFRLCNALGIRPNSCSDESSDLHGCCCDRDSCNAPPGVNIPAVDTFPSQQAERCFTGFKTPSLGGSPLGMMMRCQGDCVTYRVNQTMIFGCDPITVCEQLGAKDKTIYDDGLEVHCCSTPECTFSPPKVANVSCMNGLSIIAPELGFNYSKGQSLPCIGQCARYTTVFGRLNVNVYTCDPFNVCQLPETGSVTLNTTCCSNADNCNVLPTLPVTQVPGGRHNNTCFQGFSFKRRGAFGMHMPCDGDCTRVHIGSDTIYTCDPADTCHAFGIDGCHNLGDGLSVCCCHESNCNEPERPIRPAFKRDLKCFTGLGVGSTVSGSVMPCHGMCSTLTTTIANQSVTAYVCLDQELCEEHSLYEECSNLRFDRAIRGCCCAGIDNCNIHQAIPPVTPVPVLKNITCPQGLWINGRPTYGAASRITTCPGDCGSITFNTAVQGTTTSMTYYGCDPASYCARFAFQDSCGGLDNGLAGGCCCSTDMCMNPLAGVMTPPVANTTDAPAIQCFVGYAYSGVLTGGSIPCDGTCLHISGKLNNAQVDLFSCEPKGICTVDKPVVEFGFNFTCCNNKDDCNAFGFDLPPITVNITAAPILCYEGIWLDGKSISAKDKPSVCYGDCSSLSLNFPVSNVTHTATLYTCDPVTLCQKAKLVNSCGTMPQGIVSGCCCDSNLCLDPVNGVTTPNKPGLKCFTGFGLSNHTLMGGPISCDGTCLSIGGKLGNQTVNIFTCEPTGICNPQDPLVAAGFNVSCCNNNDNCNVNGWPMPHPVSTPPPVHPILCAEGLYLDDGLITKNKKPTVCFGDCASLTLHVPFNGHIRRAALYTCDPVALCKSMNVFNNCTTSPTGLVDACCCNSNYCLDPEHGVITPTSQPKPSQTIQCFTGFGYKGILQGGPLPCDGTCLSVGGLIGNTTVNVFTCEPFGICNIDQPLQQFGLNVSCCNTGDNCNVGGWNLPTASPSPSVRPHLCYEGIWVDNKPLGNKTAPKPRMCYGDCASVSISVTLNGNNHIGTLYTCDPVSLCQQVGARNNCTTTPMSMVQACCCQGDFCMDPYNGEPVPMPRPVQCFVGYATAGTLTGGSIPCDGTCMHVAGKVGTTAVDLFSCEPWGLCHNNQQFSIYGFNVSCCVNANECNAVGFDPPPINPTPYATRPKLCYEGIWVNDAPLGNKTTPRPRMCYGDCASLSVNMNFAGGNYMATLYTCDPVSLCGQLGAHNNCTTTPQGLVQGCCCDYDLCMDPANGVPVPMPRPVQCFVGFATAGTLTGGSMPCDGTCLHVAGKVGTTAVDLFSCEPWGLCQNNHQFSVYGFNFTCCANANECNAVGFDPPPIDPTPYATKPKLCYEGIWVNDAPLGNKTSPRPRMCYGDCASLSVNMNLGGANYLASLYTCDPVSLCGQLGAHNNCTTTPKGLVQACCCDYDFCMDPAGGVFKPPERPLQCFVGFAVGKALTGGSVECEGTCMHISGSVSNSQVDLFACEPRAICKDGHTISALGFNLTCCNTIDDCNAYGFDPPPIDPTPMAQTPVLCYEGIWFNNAAISSKDRPRTCYGDCSSLSASLSVGGTTYSASLYTCDPVSLCRTANLNNSCGVMPKGIVSGCCCNSNMCLDPVNGVTVPATPTTPNKPGLKCFTGFGLSNHTLMGGPISCDGTCLSIGGKLGNQTVNIFTCEPTGICNPQDPLVAAGFNVSCCNNNDNCNVNGWPIPSLPPVPTAMHPILCYEGLYLDDNAITHKQTPTVCFGDCASLTLHVPFNGHIRRAALYACDPVALCKSMKVANNCTTSPSGLVDACCCNSNYCLDPDHGITVPSVQPPQPSQTIQCFTGFGYGNKLQGGPLPCDGTCISLGGKIGNTTVNVFTCEPFGICDIDKPLVALGFNVSCCNSGDNCNVAGWNLPPPPSASAVTALPHLCYEGIWLDNKPIGNKTAPKPRMCYGDCAAVSISVTLSGNSHIGTLYTCDPVSLCQQVGTMNNCTTTPMNMVKACCCNSDFCMNPYNGVFFPTPAPKPTNLVPTGSPGSASTIGISLTALLAAVIALL